MCGVPTVDLLGLESSSIAPEAVTPPQPTIAAGAAVSEPDSSADLQVIEGAGPSAPSRPPRTRGARGGREAVSNCSSFVLSRIYSRPKLHRPGFHLPRIDFDQASLKYQELLVNWNFFHSRATAQQILCEVECLVPEYAAWVSHHGYQGEGGQLASHVRSKTPTLASLYAGPA